MAEFTVELGVNQILEYLANLCSVQYYLTIKRLVIFSLYFKLLKNIV